MSPFRKYVTDSDPSPFMGVLKKMSFNAGQMNQYSGGVQRLRQVTPDGEVTLMRVGEVDFVNIYPVAKGGQWEMVFTFPHTTSHLPSLVLTLHFELKRTEIGAEVRYYFDVPIGSTTVESTYAIYKYVGGVPEITTMFAHLSNLAYTVSESDAPWVISCLLTLRDNKEPLTEPSDSPSVVSGMSFVCNYSFGWAGEDPPDHYPVNGYVVGTTYSNWANFVASGWLPTTKKYVVDVTMVNVTGDLVTSIELDYLNNDYTTILYDPSGEPNTALSPLTSIKDDYAYNGNIKPYMNNFQAGVTASMPEPWTLNYIETYYETTDPPSWWRRYEWNIYPPWQDNHPGLFQPGGVKDFPRPDYPDYGYTITTDPYSYETTKTESVYTGVDSYSNSLEISNPSQIISLKSYSAIAGDPPNIWEQHTSYTGGHKEYAGYYTDMNWAYQKSIGYSPIQLPAKNAVQSISKLGKVTVIPYAP